MTDLGAHSVTLIDTEERSLSGTVSLGRDVSAAIAVDPAEHTVYVTNMTDSDTMIDTESRQVTESRRVRQSGGSSMGGIAVDPTTHHVYIPFAEPAPTIEVLAPE